MTGADMLAMMKPTLLLAKARAQAKREGLELAMLQQLRALGLDRGMVRQYQVDPIRKHRADFCWVDKKVILEVDGGTWSGGRHSRGSGIEADAEKQSLAAIYGYRTLRATTTQVKSGVAAQWVALALGVDA